jgi:hypothetical protein
MRRPRARSMPGAVLLARVVVPACRRRAAGHLPGQGVRSSSPVDGPWPGAFPSRAARVMAATSLLDLGRACLRAVRPFFHGEISFRRADGA